MAVSASWGGRPTACDSPGTANSPHGCRRAALLDGAQGHHHRQPHQVRTAACALKKPCSLTGVRKRPPSQQRAHALPAGTATTPTWRTLPTASSGSTTTSASEKRVVRAAPLLHKASHTHQSTTTLVPLRLVPPQAVLGLQASGAVGGAGRRGQRGAHGAQLPGAADHRQLHRRDGVPARVPGARPRALPPLQEAHQVSRVGAAPARRAWSLRPPPLTP